MQALKEGKFKGLPSIYARQDSFAQGGLGLSGERREGSEGAGRDESESGAFEGHTGEEGWREEEEKEVLESYASEYVHMYIQG